MKIHTRTVIDIETGKILEDESYEYEGPITSCDPVTATLATVGTSLVGAYENKQAGDQTAGAANAATDLQRQQFQAQQANQAPWLQAGQGALTQLTAGTQPGGNLVRPFTMADYQQSPSYQWQLQQGEQQLQNQAAAQGQFYSPSFINAGQQYAQNLAQTDYNNAYNQYVGNQANTYNRLANIAGLGQTATTQLGQAGQTYANNAGNLGLTGAAARGQGAVGATNALQGGVGNYMYYNTLQNYLNQNPATSNSGYNVNTYQAPSYNLSSSAPNYGGP